MKPSERIKEIEYATTGGGIGSVEVSLWSIVKYLDEQYEPKEINTIGCNHESDGRICRSIPPQFTCKHCGQLFYR